MVNNSNIIKMNHSINHVVGNPEAAAKIAKSKTQ
jgi:hypothetical protein